MLGFGSRGEGFAAMCPQSPPASFTIHQVLLTQAISGHKVNMSYDFFLP